MALVSVVLPTYNRAQVLRDALESIVNQTVKDVEILVVDDGSTDETLQMLSQHYAGSVKVISGAHAGVSAARNKGIQAARGELIAFLDSDDIWLPHKLEMVIDVFHQHPEAGMVTSNLWVVDQNNERVLGIKPRVIPGTTYAQMLEQGSGQPSSMVIKRKCFDAVGLFDPTTDGMEDLDLCLRVAKEFKVIHIDEPLGRYREQQLNANGWRRVYRGFIRTYDKALQETGTKALKAQLIQSVRRKLAIYHYLLGVLEGREGRRLEGCGHILRSIFLWPLLGLALEEHQRGWSRLGNLLKPYGILGLFCFLPWLVKARQEHASLEQAS